MQQTPPNTSISKRMALLTWAAVFVVMFLFFEDQITAKINPNSDPQSIRNGDEVEVKLKRNAAGHYMVSGEINGHPVVFLLDTGATTVTVPYHLAERLNLVAGRPQNVSTANGMRTVYQTSIDSLNIDAIKLYNISANLNEGMTGQYILLGMSALKQLDFKQQDGWLHLYQSN